MKILFAARQSPDKKLLFRMEDLSESFTIDKQSPDQRDSKNNKDDPVDPV